MLQLTDAEKAGHGYHAQTFDIKPLRYVDVPKATRHSVDAFSEDSETKYLADADTTPFWDQRQYVRQFAFLVDSVRLLQTFCINGGESLILIGGSGRTRGPLGAIVQPLFMALAPEEYRKRRNEIVEKVSELVKAAFGNSPDDMIEIHGLSTAPEKQGLGYASALMGVVGEMADAQGRGVYAITTDAYRFYEAQGYTVLQEGFIGGDNPKWDGLPIGFRIVYRAPKALTERGA